MGYKSRQVSANGACGYFEVGKIYTTRNRKYEVTITHIRKGSRYPIRGKARSEEDKKHGTWTRYSWTSDGRWLKDIEPSHNLDLLQEAR